MTQSRRTNHSSKERVDRKGTPDPLDDDHMLQGILHFRQYLQSIAQSKKDAQSRYKRAHNRRG